MSQKANPKLIGAFVIGGFALAVAAVAVFATGRLFSETTSFVMFFDHSVKGLRVGAPVDFRGVQVGTVTDIVVEYNVDTGAIRVPVIIQLNSKRTTTTGGQAGSTEQELQRLVDRGLRAQLQTQSLVTGQQLIQFDFFPDDEPTYRGGDHSLPEIPTVASSLDRLQESLGTAAEQAPELIAEATVFLSSAGELIDEENKAAIHNILANFERFSAALAESDTKIGQVLDETTDFVVNLREASEDLQTVLTGLQDNRDNITVAITELGAAGAAVTRMADQVNLLVAENRPGVQDFTSEGLYELTGLAQDAQDMVNQINRVAAELERDPARFLFGERQGVGTE